eukprot:152403-Rhodomonas_salina.2
MMHPTTSTDKHRLHAQIWLRVQRNTHRIDGESRYRIPAVERRDQLPRVLSPVRTAHQNPCTTAAHISDRNPTQSPADPGRGSIACTELTRNFLLWRVALIQAFVVPTGACCSTSHPRAALRKRKHSCPPRQTRDGPASALASARSRARRRGTWPAHPALWSTRAAAHGVRSRGRGRHQLVRRLRQRGASATSDIACVATRALSEGLTQKLRWNGKLQYLWVKVGDVVLQEMPEPDRYACASQPEV